jgi:hypothetical protein
MQYSLQLNRELVSTLIFDPEISYWQSAFPALQRFLRMIAAEGELNPFAHLPQKEPKAPS